MLYFFQFFFEKSCKNPTHLRLLIFFFANEYANWELATKLATWDWLVPFMAIEKNGCGMYSNVMQGRRKGPPSFFSDQLTLSQPRRGGGQIMPTTLLLALLDFQTFRHPCKCNVAFDHITNTVYFFFIPSFEKMTY